MITIKRPSRETSINVYDDKHLDDMQQFEPKFFSAKFGRRETFSVHRGQLIVRHTVRFSNGCSSRKTVLYFVVANPDCDNKPYLLCMGSDFSSARQAQRFIDRVFKEGTLPD